jgi:hypothetical protein
MLKHHVFKEHLLVSVFLFFCFSQTLKPTETGPEES